MYESTQDIFEYLPIRTNQVESDYITHLWSAVETISGGVETAQPFVMMPFHLLFMLALQYKIMRISKAKRTSYLHAFTMSVCRDSYEVANPASVFTLTKLYESNMVDLFKLVDLDTGTISEIKNLVKYRNENLAHANGGIAVDAEQKIDDYIRVLRLIQDKYKNLNDTLCNAWLSQMKSDDDPSEFAELHLAEEFLCPADFETSSLGAKYPRQTRYLV